MPRPEHKPIAPTRSSSIAARALLRTLVVKKLGPAQPGAVKLARRYGDALVCVRYRHDTEHRYRYTTVELVVDCARIQRRNRSLDEIVAVHIPFSETARQMQAQVLGARWDEKRRIWYMRRGTAKQLGLLRRVVETLPGMGRREDDL